MRFWREKLWTRADLFSVLSIVAITFTARSSIADHYVVPTGSMNPTVHVGDHIVVSKLAYGLRVPLTQVKIATFAVPARGDVVVLESPENGTVLLKRVIAVGGDRVAVHEGVVHIDGVVQPTAAADGGLHESLNGRMHALGSLGGSELEETRVPKGQLLVMGDNRDNSHDGRDFGFVSEGRILGRAIAVFVRDGGLGWQEL